MESLVWVVHIVIAVSLIALVLLQHGKGARLVELQKCISADTHDDRAGDLIQERVRVVDESESE